MPERYNRVLLKLSGEVFGGGGIGVDADVVSAKAREIAEIANSGVQVAVEKYGIPDPAPKMTTRPFSIWRSALRGM